MTFGLPQALLLAAPLMLVLWARGWTPGWAGMLRCLGTGCILVALARPACKLPGGGTDLIVVVDRSRSMPPGSDRHAEELIRDVEAEVHEGDRVGVVAFGRTVRVERVLSAAGHFEGFQREVDPDGSDLAAALDLALEIVPPEREARVLVLGDGLTTGSADSAARHRLAQRGVPADFRLFTRNMSLGDFAVRSIDVPAQVVPGEPFEFTATVHASGDHEVPYVLHRGKVELARGQLAAHRGDNAIMFRDRIDGAGIGDYALELEVEDAVPENNHGRAVMRVSGPPRVVVVRPDKSESALFHALQESGFQVQATTEAPRSLDALEGVAVVVLENTPASALGTEGLETLTHFVRDAGGGLLMTGGRRSFGEGGYHLSTLEPVLPVSLELREEQHRAHIALGISMDRSGSMSVLTPDGRPKIKLAAEGAIAALTLLKKGDQAAVWVVDTVAHELFPLTPVEWGLSLDLVAEIESEGGGIYIGEALRAAADELARAKTPTRHLLLFADADDSELPADYRETLVRMKRDGITVSVIGMGTSADKDAQLLTEIARLGNGQIYFSNRVDELPRLFAEDTIVLARASFVDTPARLTLARDMALLGAPEGGELPTLGGYNLTYLRPAANVALRSADQNAAPVLSFWKHGRGSAAAFTGEVDGEFSGGLRRWTGFRSLFSRVVRQLMPPPESGEVLAKSHLEGDDLHVTVEVEHPADARASPATVTLVAGDGNGQPVTVPLEWEDGHRLGAHFPLASSGTFFPLANVGGRIFRVAPAALPYPAEWEPRDPAEGRANLEELARETGGVERLSTRNIFGQTGEKPGQRPLDLVFVCAALAFLLLEVAVRRLAPAGVPLPRVRVRARRRRVAPADVPAPVQRPDATGSPSPEKPATPPPPRDPTQSGIQSALDQARERVKNRL